MEDKGFVDQRSEDLKGLRAWAKEKGPQLPDKPELNPVQIVALAAFPDIEKAFHAKLQEGYKLLTFKYESNEKTGHEGLDITFSKGYERFVMTQGKGHYVGGYSHATFGREGERGEIL